MKKIRIKNIIVLLLLFFVLIPLLSILSLFLYSLKLGVSERDALNYFIFSELGGDKKIFISTDNACSIEAQDDWTTVPGRKKTEILHIKEEYQGNLYVWMFSYAKEDAHPLSLEDFTEMIIKNLKRNFKSPIIYVKKIITVNNRKVLMILSDGTLGNKEWTNTEYIIDTPNAFYHLSCGAIPSRRKYASLIFRDMLESFKLIKPGDQREP